jgi:hypothetical protein
MGLFETILFYRLSPRQYLVTKGFCLAEEGANIWSIWNPAGRSA